MILYTRMSDKLKNGFFFGLGLVLCFTARFTIEFVKENQVGFEDGMLFNMGQLLSLPYIALGLGFIIYGLRKTNAQRPLFICSPCTRQQALIFIFGFLLFLVFIR